MNEIWRDIEGYDGLYQVSNHGRVKSLKFGRERVLRPSMKGYPSVQLCKHPEPICIVRVHRLVAEAFLKPDDSRPHVNHRDGNPQNNHVSNLEWCTHAENMAHARGVLKRGSGKALFTPEQASDVVELRRKGLSTKEIADALGVSLSTVIRYMRDYAPETLKTIKLTDADVLRIVSLYESGRTMRQIADGFGVSEGHISRILKGNRRNRNQEQAS